MRLRAMSRIITNAQRIIIAVLLWLNIIILTLAVLLVTGLLTA